MTDYVFHGKVASYEATDPGALGSLFGNSTLNFYLTAFEDVDMPWGKTKDIPIRLDCFARPPKIEGRTVLVAGAYDTFDTIVRAKSLYVPEGNLYVGAARRINPWLAWLIFVLVGSFQITFYTIITGIFANNIIQTGVPIVEIFLSAVILFVIFCLNLFLIWIFLRLFFNMLMASMNEGIARFTRQWTEYRRGPRAKPSADHLADVDAVLLSTMNQK